MKTVKEIIEELQDLVEADPALENVPVYVYADHGHIFTQGFQVTLGYTESYDYYVDPVDLEEYDSPNSSKAFVCIGD